MDIDVVDKLTGLGLLSTMIMPAVLILTCGALIFRPNAAGPSSIARPEPPDRRAS
jgi:hypothetical protein